jgi:hypothetical protein
MEWPNGKQEWWFNGMLHRGNGPAITYEDGTYEWWVDGKQYNNGIDISNVIARGPYYGQ